MKTAQLGALWPIVSTRMPTKWGMFEAIGSGSVARVPAAEIETLVLDGVRRHYASWVRPKTRPPLRIVT